jgi:hypothetical protein
MATVQIGLEVDRGFWVGGRRGGRDICGWTDGSMEEPKAKKMVLCFQADLIPKLSIRAQNTKIPKTNKQKKPQGTNKTLVSRQGEGTWMS